MGVLKAHLLLQEDQRPRKHLESAGGGGHSPKRALEFCTLLQYNIDMYSFMNHGQVTKSAKYLWTFFGCYGYSLLRYIRPTS